MSYQVIARKWRPQNFDQLVGQSHISVTLQNALKNGRLPHALLFTGPRGTGKTSSARILAKSLRCPNAQNFIPCGTCVECEEIALSRSPNVMEIDGASNNGVDAIRDLRSTVAYAPSSGKYKIYIIDEVHMLSASAFNALLKTLEEPPDHVIFIMATTEVHKIPMTILSRCQRFDFKRIATRQITDRLKMICEAEGIQAEEEALWIIARQGDGSMRDSQSLLDQVITFANGQLTQAAVVPILGLTDRTLILEALTGLVERNSATLLDVLKKLATTGHEPHLFVQDVLENLRHLLLLKVAKGTEKDFIDLPDSEIRFLSQLSGQVSEEDLHLLFDMALKGASEITRSVEPRIVLEMVILRMGAAPRVMDLMKLTASTPPPSPQPLSKPKIPLNQPPHDRWFELVQEIKNKDSLLAAKIEHLLFLGVNETSKTIELGVPAKMAFLKDQVSDPAAKEKLQALIQQRWGQGYRMELKLAKEQATETQVAPSAKAMQTEIEKKKYQDLSEKVAAHPKVRAANAVFKGQIKEIKERT